MPTLDNKKHLSNDQAFDLLWSKYKCLQQKICEIGCSSGGGPSEDIYVVSSVQAPGQPIGIYNVTYSDGSTGVWDFTNLSDSLTETLTSLEIADLVVTYTDEDLVSTSFNIQEIVTVDIPIPDSVSKFNIGSAIFTLQDGSTKTISEVTPIAFSVLKNFDTEDDLGFKTYSMGSHEVSLAGYKDVGETHILRVTASIN